MARHRSSHMTITIPRDVRTRMLAVKEEVNWSAVACRAFEDRLAEIAARKEKKDMADVLERLRACLRNEQSTHFNDGYVSGTKWAEKTASPAELMRLESFQKAKEAESPRAWERWFAQQGEHSRWVDLVTIIQQNNNSRTRKAQEFWKDSLGETTQPLNYGEYLQGFAEAAIELWKSVQEEL